MAHILHLDSSPRGERSISRRLSHDFIQAWQAVHPEDTVTYRDLGHQPVPHVDEPWIAATYSPPETLSPELKTVIQASDVLLDEFLAADYYVCGVPMYNFNVPSTFKAYIDQIVRVNRTFAVTDTGLKGLVEEGKKMLVLTARGGVYAPGSPAASVDFQEPFLRAIFGFIGVTDITFIHAENLNMGDDARTAALAEAQAAIQMAVAHW
ncbi:FMN-dependent NADH-azoreductase [Candidatus Cyanaurora vandensis]|uniref:FMN-dependent NADH-azoreductase n=1 Tax=Candidatus Cyanaurora vandensis TaxID=2714958 RepID=UPI0025798194|nr:FMN-dependent NADH-azoreductase [Candidatus Cyanaurora vandensis]